MYGDYLSYVRKARLNLNDQKKKNQKTNKKNGTPPDGFFGGGAFVECKAVMRYHSSNFSGPDIPLWFRLSLAMVYHSAQSRGVLGGS